MKCLNGGIRSGTKGRRTAIFATTMVALMSVPAILYSFGANPPLPNTGAPGEGTCASCHGTLTSGSGVTVNAPASYTPGGAAVSMTVSVPTSGGTSQGFELTILTQSGNAQAGTLAAGPPPTGAAFPQDTVSTVGTRQYVYSTVENTSWTFGWTPPATNVGNVVVYVTGGNHGTNFSNSFVINAPVVTPPPTPTLSATPTQLTFTVNGAEPATQQVMVTSSVPLTGTVTTGVSTSSAGNWLTVVPPGGNTPLTATVGIVATGLGTGTYQGSVSFTNSSAQNSPISVPVTLTVTTMIPPPVTTPTLTVSSTGLNFTATVGAAAPSSQSVTVSTSTGSAVTFTDSATTSSGGSWLSVDTAADTTPTSEPISIATVPSTPGTYQGTVTFNSSATSPNSVTLPVTLTVNSPTTTPPPTTGLPWSFNLNVVDRLLGGTDYMLLTGNGGMNSTSQLSGSGSFTRFLALPTATASGRSGGTHSVLANGRWRVTGMTSSNLTTSTTTSSTGVTTTRVTGGTVVLQVSITIQGCNSGGGDGGDDGAPAPTPSPITGTLTVVSTGGSTSGISLTYQGTCASTSSTGTTTTTAVSGSFASVGIGTYSLGGGGDN